MEKIVLIKLGGAILTDKTKPCTIRQDVIELLSKQIQEYLGQTSSKVILGNGGGSFGHYFAEKYSLVQGIADKEGMLGMCKGKNGNAYLNSRLVEALTKRGVPACSYSIEDVFGLEYGNDEACLESWKRLLAYLKYGIVPVVYGDIVFKLQHGCEIISTERIFENLAQLIKSNFYKDLELERIIFCTDKNGVEDDSGEIIGFIDRNVFNNWRIFERSTKGYDVTGGMQEKVRIALDKNITCPVQIINGKIPGNLYRALCGDTKLGTVIGG